MKIFHHIFGLFFTPHFSAFTVFWQTLLYNVFVLADYRQANDSINSKGARCPFSDLIYFVISDGTDIPNTFHYSNVIFAATVIYP